MISVNNQSYFLVKCHLFAAKVQAVSLADLFSDPRSVTPVSKQKKISVSQKGAAEVAELVVTGTGAVKHHSDSLIRRFFFCTEDFTWICAIELFPFD